MHVLISFGSDEGICSQEDECQERSKYLGLCKNNFQTWARPGSVSGNESSICKMHGRAEFSIHYRHALVKCKLFLVPWLIRVVMAIRNTYENKTECKQVLQRKGRTHWEFDSFWVVLTALAAVSTSAQGERGMVATENGTWGMSLRLSSCSELRKHAAGKLLAECAPLTSIYKVK